MKSLATFLIVFYSFNILLSSCSDDSEPSNTIVGTWVLLSITVSECDDDDMNESHSYTCNAVRCVTTKMTKDGQFIRTAKNGSLSDTSEASYTDDGNQIEICNEMGECNQVQYELIESNNRLVLTATDVNTGCFFREVLRRN